MTKQLQKLIEEFKARNRNRWTTLEKAKGECTVASYEFHNLLVDKGMKPETWDIVLDEDHDRYICPEWYPNRDSEGHCVVFIEGLVIDWTARQYNPKAPYPLVFVPKFGGDRKLYEKDRGY